MFVVDAARGGARFEETVRHIAQLLTRQGAEIERVEKW
ncbi:MAG: 30S ribosomal protein S6, partial [Candidatus Brocadiae bacterium]|nr:30S ribosomal protein S6 [Candidatus Brocadiia bacterium]